MRQSALNASHSSILFTVLTHLHAIAAPAAGGVSWQDLLSTATVVVAIGGLVTTVWINRLDRRSSLNAQQQQALMNSSGLLSSDNPATRAVGMAAAVDFLRNPQLRMTAHRIALNALHFEVEPIVIEHVVDAFVAYGLSGTSLNELSNINRHIWRSILDQLSERAIAGDSPSSLNAAPSIEELVNQLRRNQRIISRLLAGGTFANLDFSNAFLADLNASGTTFHDCNFSSTFLHYANLQGAHFQKCSFERALLVGAYLERSSFLDCNTEEVVALAGRLHLEESHEDRIPENVISSAVTPCRSFMYETEQEWRGHWRGLPDSKDFEAHWRSPTPAESVRATMTETSAGFLRRASSDSNDGEYSIALTHTLDRERSVRLVTGVRTLRSGIPGVWRGIWWQQLARRVSSPARAETQWYS